MLIPSARRRRADGGFTLVELMVSMFLFALVAVATTPMLIGALKSGRSSKLNLQAKALGQERLEQLRNLPYHVDRANGVFIDLLDTFFRDLQPMGTITAANPGAVPPIPADTCSIRTYTAATYTYTCTIGSTTLGTPYTGFTQVVTSQFVDAARTPVQPPATYDSQVSGADAPVSNLLSLSITTKWTDAGKAKSYVVQSQISNSKAPVSTLQTDLRASALTLNSNTAGGDVLHFEGGTLSADGSLDDGSVVNASALAANAQVSSGASASGATFGASKPIGTSSSTPGTSQLLLGDCVLTCFDSSTISGDTSISITNGLHKVSTSGNPLVSQLNRDGTGVPGSFSFGTGSPAQLDPSLGIVGSPISGATTGNLAMKSSGYVDTTGSGPTSVVVTSTATVPFVSVFATAAAPNGLVQLKQLSATLTCSTGGGSGAVTATWAGVVSYLGADNVYHDLVLGPGAAQLPIPSAITVKGGFPLSRWISSWSTLTSSTSVVQQTDATAKGTMPGFLSILTVPTRTGDPTSPINITVAPMSCLAMDNR